MRWHWLALLVLLWLAVAGAQDAPARLSLTTTEPEWQTGRIYEVAIQAEDVRELWLATLEIAYDPDRVYVIGTESGSPVALGSVFAGQPAGAVFNYVIAPGRLTLTASFYNPAQPFSGNGFLGSLQVVPLQPGDLEMRLESVQLTRLDFNTDQESQRIASNPQPIAFVTAPLSVAVLGSVVTPPPEASATPTPSPTPDESSVELLPEDEVTPTLEIPALADRTIASDPASEGSQDGLLIVAIVLISVACMGLLILALWWRRNRP